jgi:hypothetical protein
VYLLAACLFNRADALVRMGDVGPTAAALASYDEGIAALQRIPLAEDPLYPRRLAMGFQNRGLALQARARDGRRRSGRGIVCRRAGVLDQEYSQGVEDRPYLRAVVLLNLANVRALQASDEGTPPPATQPHGRSTPWPASRLATSTRPRRAAGASRAVPRLRAEPVAGR